MTISVIIPNYNHAPFLRQRIDSVLEQTFQDIEVILLDDCSTDNSREIIESYRQNPKVSHIIYNSINSGSPFIQWSKGISLASGDWIWIAESDDWADTHFLQEMVDCIQNNSNTVLAFCNSIHEYINSSIIGYQISEHRKDYSGIDFIKKHLLYDIAVYNASSAIFRREVAIKISNTYTTYKSAGDKLFWISICEHGDVTYLPKPLNHFRHHENETSVKASISGELYEEEIRIFDTIRKRKYISVLNIKNVVNYHIEHLNTDQASKYRNQWEKRMPKQFLIKFWSFISYLKSTSNQE